MTYTAQNKTIIFFSVGAAIIISVIILLTYSEILHSKPRHKCSADIENSYLPKTSLFESQNDKDFSDNVQKGKVMLIFMNTDCAACQFESEIISASSDSIGSQVKIYGVLREDKGRIQDFIINHKINFQLLIDKGGKLFDEFKIECTPTNLIIQDGLIEKVLIGSPKDSEMLFKDLDISN